MHLWLKRVIYDSFKLAMLAAATFFILHSIIDVQVRILIVSNEINTKEKKNHAPMAQTSQNDSFGLVWALYARRCHIFLSCT